MTNPIKSRDGQLRGAAHAPVHDMDQSLPVDSLKNVARKSQQLKARAVAGRHIDEALSGLPISDDTKASRKAKLIDVPAARRDGVSASIVSDGRGGAARHDAASSPRSLEWARLQVPRVKRSISASASSSVR